MVTFLKLFPDSTDISSDEIVQDTKFNKKQNSKNQVQNEFHAKNLRSPSQYGSKDASTIHPQSQQTPLHSESILKINSESKISIQFIDTLNIAHLRSFVIKYKNVAFDFFL